MTPATQIPGFYRSLERSKYTTDDSGHLLGHLFIRGASGKMSIKDLKLVVVGDGSVGKTSMLQCFKDNKYDSTDTAQFL